MSVQLDEKLTAQARKGLALSSFALPLERKYPIPDLSHARDALARLSQAKNAGTITSAQYTSALQRIYAKYPSLKPTKDAMPRVWFDATTSNFGWKVGDKCAYTYRSAKNPEGTVTAVHPGTTRDNTTVSIRPAPGFHFGEGIITRHITKIRHIGGFSARAKAPVQK